MNTDIKQAMHVEAGKSFGTAEANENERRWNDDKIERKNQDPTNHYDKTRMKLNFEIGPDGKIHPLGYQEKPLEVRLQERLDELGWKPFKADSKIQPNCCAKFVFEATMTGRLKWLSRTRVSIWRKEQTIATCTVARELRIGRKMSMIGVSEDTGRKTLSGFRCILMRAVRIFMPWLFR